MFTPSLSVLVVFLEGLASFLSPCVLPLIPVYLAYLTGQSAEAVLEDAKAQRMLIINGAAFVAGFSLIFILMGATATGLGKFLLNNNDLLRQASALLVILFGLFTMGILPLSFLNYEKRVQISPRTPGLFTSFLLGMGFSFGWTPCIGPVLSSVLILASRSATLYSGMGLLAVYSLGLGLPFLLLAVFYKSLWKYLRGLYKYMKGIKVVSGALLVIMGILIWNNTFGYLATF